LSRSRVRFRVGVSKDGNAVGLPDDSLFSSTLINARLYGTVCSLVLRVKKIGDLFPVNVFFAGVCALCYSQLAVINAVVC